MFDITDSPAFQNSLRLVRDSMARVARMSRECDSLHGSQTEQGMVLKVVGSYEELSQISELNRENSQEFAILTKSHLD